MSLPVWVGVAVLGGFSAIARFAAGSWVTAHAGRRFPYGTFAVNASASLLLGLVVGLSASGQTLLLAGAAAIGSYSTFSTWIVETHRLAKDGENGAAILNVLFSLAIGLGAAALGRVIGTGL